MRKLIKALCLAFVMVFAISAFACDIGIKRKTPTADKYFNFELQNDQTYAISVNEELKSDLPSSIILPSSYKGVEVTAIDVYGFANTQITKIAIPDGYKVIGGYAFYNCQKLTTIEFGNTVQTLSKGAFSGCISLVNTIILPSSVSVIEENAFAYCTSLLVIDIPINCIVNIEAFDGCKDTLTINKV